MAKYIHYGVNISDAQKKKIKKALECGSEVSIRLSKDDLQGDDVLAFTKSQINKIQKAMENNKGVTIKMSKAQIKENLKVEGGFLSALAGLAASALPVIAKTVLPGLATGVLSGLANAGIQKAIGNGLYLSKGGCVCRIETDGRGLYLEPSKEKFNGNGLYLSQNGQVTGSGLLLGPNSPFKNIPLIGMIL